MNARTVCTAAGVAAAASIGVALASLAWVQAPGGEQQLARWLERAAAAAVERGAIRIGGLRIDGGQIELVELRIDGAEHEEVIVIPRARARVDLLALLRWRIHLSRSIRLPLRSCSGPTAVCCSLEIHT